jgi:hypothetical protein
MRRGCRTTFRPYSAKVDRLQSRCSGTQFANWPRTARRSCLVKVGCRSGRALKRRMRRQSLVHSHIVFAIAAGQSILACLSCDRPHPSLLTSSHLRLCRPCLNASTAAVVADAGYIVVHNYGAVDVGIVNDRCVYIDHGGVIAEHASGPASAVEANAAVSEPVVHAAIEANLRPPIPGVPCVDTIRPAPITGRPEQAHGWSHHPCTGNPVIAVWPPGPVARSPDVIRRGAYGLHIHRQRWWRGGNRYSDSNLSECGDGQNAQNSNQDCISNPENYFHRASFGSIPNSNAFLRDVAIIIQVPSTLEFGRPDYSELVAQFSVVPSPRSFEKNKSRP